MIELRREETAIAAPPMQEQHVRITLARRVEHNPCRASLSDGPGALSFSHSHRFLLGVGLVQEPRPQPGVAASGNTPSPKVVIGGFASGSRPAAITGTAATEQLTARRYWRRRAVGAREKQLEQTAQPADGVAQHAGSEQLSDSGIDDPSEWPHDRGRRQPPTRVSGRKPGACRNHSSDEDAEITGYSKLRLWVSAEGSDDM